MQQVQLVNGIFTPSEAADVIIGLIEKKINFHKVHRLSICEGDEKENTTYDDSRISELIKELQTAKDFISEAREKGNMLKVNGTLELEFIN